MVLVMVREIIAKGKKKKGKGSEREREKEGRRIKCIN